MGLMGLYFFIIFGAFFIFLWTNLTNYKLSITRVLSFIAFLFLLWIFAKLMLISGIGWESTKFWVLIMTAVSWFLPASFFHFAIEIQNDLSKKIHSFIKGIGIYFIPIMVSVSLFLFPSLMPLKYIFIGQWAWDGIFSDFFMKLQGLFILTYFTAAVSLFVWLRYSIGDILLIIIAFLAFFGRTFLLFFDIATYWQGWIFWQPCLAFLSYLSLWFLYRKHFWLEETFPFPVLQKLLKNFSFPIMIIKNNYHLFYFNEALKAFCPHLSEESIGTSIEKYQNLFSKREEFFTMLSRLSVDNPISYGLITLQTPSGEHTFYTHSTILLFPKKTIAGYIITFNLLESEKITHLAQKHIDLHRKLENLYHTYQEILHTIEDPLFLTDLSWKIKDINPAAYKLLGFNPEKTSLENAFLPLPSIVMEQMKKSDYQKFLLEIDFGKREWQKLQCQRKDTTIVEFFVKKIGDSFLFLLKDTQKKLPQEEYRHFEGRFYRYIHQLNMEILSSPTQPPWKNILDIFVEIFSSGEYIVAISEVSNNEIVTPRAIHGIDTTLFEKIENLLGTSLFSLPLRIPPHFSLEKNIMLSGKLNKITGGLQELFFYSMNPMVTMILEHIIGVGDIYSIGISRGETIYALFVILIKKGYTFPELEWIEPFGEEISKILTLRASFLGRENPS